MEKRRKLFRVLAPLLGLMLVTAACGGDGEAPTAEPTGEPQNIEELIDAAQEEGELTIQGGAHDFIDALEEAMNAKYNIDISLNAIPGSMSEMVTRLIQEHEAGQKPTTDVLFTTARNRIDLQDAGASEPVDWKKYDPTISDEEITRDSSGIVAYGQPIGVAYNTEIVAPEDVPQSVDDLINPNFEGLMATTPYGTGWAQVALLYGEDKAREIADAMAPLVGGFLESDDFGPVITGQRPIFAFSADTGLALVEKEKGAPIDVAYPFPSYLLFSVDVVKGTESPNLATLFGVFIRTPEAQEIAWEYRRHDSLYVPGTNTYEQAQEADEEIIVETEEAVLENPEIYLEMRGDIIELFEQR